MRRDGLVEHFVGLDQVDDEARIEPAVGLHPHIADAAGARLDLAGDALARHVGAHALQHQHQLPPVGGHAGIGQSALLALQLKAQHIAVLAERHPLHLAREGRQGQPRRCQDPRQPLQHRKPPTIALPDNVAHLKPGKVV